MLCLKPDFLLSNDCKMSEMKRLRTLQLIEAESGEIANELAIRRKLAAFSDIFNQVSKNDILLIDMERNIDMICAVLCCLINSIPFTFSKENRRDRFKNFYSTVEFDGKQIYRNHPPFCCLFPRLCYVVTTSGTTGERKQVAVPVTCIKDNIEEFVHHFELTSNDTILFTTSTLFDPSIIEIFLALRTGCRLIICPDSYRHQPSNYCQVFEKYQPTFAQFTPIIFETFPDELIKNHILSSTSSLRILLLGGSMFPLDFVQRNWSPKNRTRIFDVYGLTEISCWATIFEIERYTKHVALGKPIRGTEISIRRDMLDYLEIIIGGSRKCLINGNEMELYRTGDVVEKIEKTNQYRLIGRRDAQIKIRGVRMNLEEMSKKVKAHVENVKLAWFLNYSNRVLVLFVVLEDDSKGFSPANVEKIFDRDFWPNRIEILEEMEINSNGKVAEKILRKMLDFKLKKERSLENFVQFLKKKLHFDIERDTNRSFVELGVDSLLAAEMSLFFENNRTEETMRKLLSRSTQIQRFLNDSYISFAYGPHHCATVENMDQKLQLRREKQPRMRWAHNLLKCIDGNPLVMRKKRENTMSIVTASHSGIIAKIDYTTGKLQWKKKIETRFEASPTQVENNLAIGGYDGNIYFLNGETGDIIWQFKTGDQIRASATFDEYKFLYIASYDQFVYKIKVETGQLEWKTKVEGAAASAVKLLPIRYAVMTTTTGNVYKIDKSDGSIKWHQKVSAPLFCSPLAEPSIEKLIVGGVNGELTKINMESGEIEKTCQLNRPIFCSPILIEDDTQLLVATQNGSIVVVYLESFEIRKQITFNQENIGFVRSPKIIETNQIMVMSTDSTLMLIEINEFLWNIEKCFMVSNGKVFSMPVLIENELIVTSRDDWIRCFKIFDKKSVINN